MLFRYGPLYGDDYTHHDEAASAYIGVPGLGLNCPQVPVMRPGHQINAGIWSPAIGPFIPEPDLLQFFVIGRVRARVVLADFLEGTPPDCGFRKLPGNSSYKPANDPICSIDHRGTLPLLDPLLHGEMAYREILPRYLRRRQMAPIAGQNFTHIPRAGDDA